MRLRLTSFTSKCLLAVLCLAPVSFLCNAQSVGIGTETPAASAQLDVSSSSKGFLMPRMTTAQRDNIASPATGLTIYNLDDNCTDSWNGTAWTKACGASTSLVPNPNGAWTKKADVGGGGRAGAFGFTIGTKLYLGGGDLGQAMHTSDMWAYDPATGNWTQMASIPTGGRMYSVGFTIGSKGYVTGGTVGGFWSSDFWQYDPAGNTWVQKANFPRNTGNMPLAFGIGTKGYVGGGFSSAFQGDWYEYDPVTDGWTAKAPMPGLRAAAASFVINGLGYFATSFNNGNITNDCYAYDPVANSWTIRASFPGSPRSEAAGFAIGQKGYVGTGNFNNDFWEYDPTGNTWSRKADYGGHGSRLALGFAIGQKGYMGSGGGLPGVLADFLEYDPNGMGVFVKNDFASANAYQYGDGSWNRAGTNLFTANNDFLVGIGTASPSTRLEVAGTIKSTGLQLTTGAANGSILKSDANGLGSWVSPNVLGITAAGAAGGDLSGTYPNPSLAASGITPGTYSKITVDAKGRATGGAQLIAADITPLETDPKVGSNTTNYLSKWNGTALVSSAVFENNGNVGIGTPTPNASLQLSNIITNRRLVIWENANNDHQYFGFGVNAGAIRYQVDGVTGNHIFYAGTSSTTSQELMRIVGNGNVGIGIVPARRLDVSGTGGLRVSSTNPGSGTTDWIAGNFGGTAGDRVVMGNQTSVATIGAHNNALNAWANLSINAGGGNVGIGTVTPVNKLDVKGGVAIGSSYAGTNTAPVNGAIIEGNVVIGNIVSATSATLEVYGNAKIGKAGTNLSGIVKRTLALPAGNFAANSSPGVTFAFSGALMGGSVMVSPSSPLPAGMVIAYAWVSSNNNVDVVFRNTTGAIIPYAGGINLYITVVTD